MRKISKVLSYTLVLCMVLCTLSFNAFAAQLTAESEVLYTTTFRTDEFTAGDYNLSSGSSLQIGESDWYIENPASNPLDKHLEFQVTVSGTTKTFNTLNANNRGMESTSEYLSRQSNLVLEDSSVYSNLTDSYKISAVYRTTSSSLYAVPMFKFAMHTTGKNANHHDDGFYMLAFPGNGAYKAFNSIIGGVGTEGTWVLYKVDGYSNVTKLLSSDATIQAPRNVNVRPDITVEGGRITVHVVIDGNRLDETKSCVDPSPFNVDIQDTKFAIAANRTYGGTSHLQFSKYQVENIVSFPVPDDAVYADVATDLNGSNVMDLGEGYRIKRIKNNSDSAVTVQLSNDGTNFDTLASVNASELYDNEITATKYRYVKLSDAADVSIYTYLNEVSFSALDDGVGLLVRAGGEDLVSPTLTTGNANTAYISDGKIYPLREGTTTLSANGSVVDNITIAPSKSVDLDFASYTAGSRLTLSKDADNHNAYEPLNVNADWIYRFADYTNRTNCPTNNNGYVESRDGDISLVGTTGGTYMRHPGYPILMYNGDLTGMGKSYQIDCSVQKSNVVSGYALRFMIHNNGQNFYQLEINGAQRRDDNYWSFVKVENGSVVDKVVGPELAAVQYPYFTGRQYITLNVSNDGTISWVINGQVNRVDDSAIDYTGSYSDKNLFNVSLDNTKLGFIQTRDSAGDRQVYIKSFAISSASSEIVPVINGETLKAYVDDSSLADSTAYKFLFVEFNNKNEVVKITSSNENSSGSNVLTYTMLNANNRVESFVIDSFSTLRPLFKSFVLN